MADFSHLNEAGEAAMVDVSAKTATSRVATVGARVRVSRTCAEQLDSGSRREIITTARIAGIQGGKRTSELIPMCHPIPLSKLDVAIDWDEASIAFNIQATAKTQAVTGVEMEAMAAASVAAMTIYDMVKAVCPEAVIDQIGLHEKSGGKAGHWKPSPGGLQ